MEKTDSKIELFIQRYLFNV